MGDFLLNWEYGIFPVKSGMWKISCKVRSVINWQCGRFPVKLGMQQFSVKLGMQKISCKVKNAEDFLLNYQMYIGNR